LIYGPAAVSSQSSSSPSRARHGSYRSGFAFGILSFLAVAALGFVSTIVTARIYGVRVVGAFALSFAPVAALWVLSTAKEQAALIKEITGLPPRHPRITQLFAVVLGFSTALTVVMSLLAAVAAWLLFRGPLHHPELVAPTFVNLAGYAIVTNTGWNVDAIFSAFVAGRQLFWVRLHETMSFIAIATALGLAWHSIWGLVLATIAGSLSALVHRVIAVRPFVRARLSRAQYREGLNALPGLLRFGLKITPGSIAQGITQQAGVWAIGAVSPIAVVGAYSRAQTIPDRLQQVNVRIVEALYPTLVKRRASGDGAGFDRALIDSIRYALTGMLLIAALCGGTAHGILALFGSGFSRAAPALALLALYPALASIAVAQTQALYTVDRPGLTSIIALCRMALTVALTVLLTPSVGLTGPAIALLAGFVLDIGWRALALRRHLMSPLPLTWSRREQLALVIAYGGGFGAARQAFDALPSTGGLLLGLAAGTAAYGVLLVLVGGINQRDRQRLVELRDQARSWRARRHAPAPEQPAAEQPAAEPAG
jgi:O-antigen/teichoic acid export membrane protein